MYKLGLMHTFTRVRKTISWGDIHRIWSAKKIKLQKKPPKKAEYNFFTVCQYGQAGTELSLAGSDSVVISEGEDYRCFLIASSSWIIFITRNLFLPKKKKKERQFEQRNQTHTQTKESTATPGLQTPVLGVKAENTVPFPPHKPDRKATRKTSPCGTTECGL